MADFSNTLVICPTWNPGGDFVLWCEALDKQSLKPAEVLIVDSGSEDDVLARSLEHGYRVKKIMQSEFNHGGTRAEAVKENGSFDFYVFLTQDAILIDETSLECILRPFVDPQVGAVCGRQMPRPSAGVFEKHARLFNYPEKSHSRSIKDAMEYGVKTAFLSDSFSAYRREALVQVGGIPADVIFGEDMYVATKMLLAGYSICYAADASVYHSHNYTVTQEFKRYFDMGVFHAREPWIRQELGAAEGEGLKFVISELKYLLRHAFWRIPEGVLRTSLRYVGFRLGLAGVHIPLKLKKKMSMNPGYFKIK